MSSAVVVGLLFVVALLGVLVIGLLRSHAEILRALHDLGVNLDPALPASSAPIGIGPWPEVAASDVTGRELDLVGTTPDGSAQRVAVAGTRHRTLIAFLSSSCLTCRSFWSSFSDPSLTVPGGARIVIVTQDPTAESPSAVAELAPPHLPVVMSTDAWQRYAVPGAPYFVVADGPTGRIVGQGAGPTWARVTELLHRAIADAGGGAERAERVDDVLRAAGIEPGDASLYPPRTSEQETP